MQCFFLRKNRKKNRKKNQKVSDFRIFLWIFLIFFNGFRDFEFFYGFGENFRVLIHKKNQKHKNSLIFEFFYGYFRFF